MALVTLTVAKRHLYVTDSDHDEDIELKIEQASDIILNYLKGRQIAVTSITRTGAVATVTTAVPHGLTSLGTVTVRGAIEPEYNGTVVATVTSTTVFTFPVAGTPAATATGTILLSATETWTTLTVPARIQAAVLLMLARLHEQRGDDEEADADCWSAIERLLMRDRDPALA